MILKPKISVSLSLSYRITTASLTFIHVRDAVWSGSLEMGSMVQALPSSPGHGKKLHGPSQSPVSRVQVQGPSFFLCSPSSGSAQNIGNISLSDLNETGFLLHELDVIGCDVTVTNTGWKTGVICQIEKQVKRQLLWGVCLLQFNELPFRHLFLNLDGETTAPISFSGPLATRFSKCEKLPVLNFKSSKCKILEIERKILSKDQQYLLDISYAIKSGSSPEDLTVREPGPVSLSRWLTTANRALRLYLSIENPADEHKILVSFFLKSHMPVWFHIKKKKLLLSMIVDKRDHIIELGFRIIIKARYLASKRKSVRSFQPPKTKFLVTDYIEMIHWNTITLAPPPLLKRFSNQEIWSKIRSGGTAAEWNFGKFPCHAQAAKRYIKLITKASKTEVRIPEMVL
ncbi:hypothetical protein AVEN_202615-1 [Araneus ventricosus]|uniref:Uncharacterized protein n=1 Tax=Araneus ventricosus TaxID=182803 RepID=A0A4Y2TAW7_ARAVE|nr:hypothetical protein AVEN_202615-1 [Araneus ventricosus]